MSDRNMWGGSDDGAKKPKKKNKRALVDKVLKNLNAGE